MKLIKILKATTETQLETKFAKFAENHYIIDVSYSQIILDRVRYYSVLIVYTEELRERINIELDEDTDK